MSHYDNSNRRYDIDWLRVIAIGVLLLFHIMVIFQLYAKQLEFVQSPDPLEILLVPMSLFGVMRIPLLFFVSGMGVYFSLQKRTWQQFLGERTLRILVPLIFGTAVIVPIQLYIFAEFYSNEFIYKVDVHHLWFLLNIYMYVLWFFALFYFFKEVTENKYFDYVRSFLKKYPLAIYLFIIPYVIQAFFIPADRWFTQFYDSGVGLILGAIAFLLGFIFVAIGESFWKAVSKYKYYSLILAFIIFLIRIFIYKGRIAHPITAVESIMWIYASLGLGYRFLNRPGKALSYLSKAAYPIYIVHMIFLNLGGFIILPFNLNPWLSFILIILFTFVGSFVSYEIIRRIILLRPLFGMKIKRRLM